MAYPEGMRPFHDFRVTSITNDAIAGANPVALMTKAVHANIATTEAVPAARGGRVRGGGRGARASSAWRSGTGKWYRSAANGSGSPTA